MSKIVPVRVLFASHASGLYGAERFLTDVLPSLPPRIRPLLLAPRRGPLSQWASERGIECVVTRFYGWQGDRLRLLKGAYRLAWNVAALIRLLGRMRKAGISLVYSNSLHSPFGAMLARALGVPHIWHAHELPAGEFLGRFDLGLHASMRLVSRSSVVVCNSETLRDGIARYVSAHKLRVVYNGVIGTRGGGTLLRRDSSRHTVGNPVSLLMVGSLCRNKGHEDAIRAVRQLRDQGQTAFLTIVGDGDRKYQSSLVRMAVELEVANIVEFVGFQNELATFYENADMVLVCSRSETFGRVIVEAMSFGCPVVATKTGGIPEIIKDGENGLLYAPGDHRALAAAVLALTNGRNLYAAISRCARETAAVRFSVERCARELVAVLDEVLATARQ